VTTAEAYCNGILIQVLPYRSNGISRHASSRYLPYTERSSKRRRHSIIGSVGTCDLIDTLDHLKTGAAYSNCNAKERLAHSYAQSCPKNTFKPESRKAMVYPKPRMNAQVL